MQDQSIDIAEFLKVQPRRIVITTHTKPDGDALGSSLGLQQVLLSLGHTVHIVLASDYGKYLAWLPELDSVTVLPHQKALGTELVQKADLIFCLDYSQWARLEDMAPLVKQVPAVKVMIDHHLEPDSFADIQIWDPGAAATCLLIYRFLKTAGWLSHLSVNGATALYTGIVTDTGSFRFQSVTPEIHEAAAFLLSLEIKHAAVHENLFDTFTPERLAFFGLCFKDRLVIRPEICTAYMAVPYQDIQAYNIKTGDTEGLVNYLLAIEGISFGVLIIEREAQVKLSFRSKSDFPANQFAAQYFNGGGHLNAAGGIFAKNLELATSTLLQGLEEWSETLSHYRV